MKLLTAHRILIGSAVALFIYYGLWEIQGWRAAGAGGGGVRGAVSFVLAAGLLFYLLSLRPKPRGGDRPGPGTAQGPRGGER